MHHRSDVLSVLQEEEEEEGHLHKERLNRMASQDRLYTPCNATMDLDLPL
jgi:hypothetical protein